jgi:hypothetical protein
VNSHSEENEHWENWRIDLKQPPLVSNHIETDHPEEEKEGLKKRKKETTLERQTTPPGFLFFLFFLSNTF